MQPLAFLFLLLAWLNGLHIGPWVSWHSELLAFAACCWMVFSVLAQRKASAAPAVSVPRTALIWPFLALTAAAQFCAGRVDFHGDLVLLVLYFWLVFAAVTAGFSMAARNAAYIDAWPKNHLVTRIAWVVVIGASLSALIALVQTLDVWPQADWINRANSLRRPGGNIAQPNQLATLLLMGIASLVYLFEKRVLRGFAALLVYAVLIAGLGLTESRTGLVSAVALTVFCLVFRKNILGKLAAISAMLGLVWLTICFKYIPTASHYLQQAGLVEGAGLTSNISAGTRLQIWPQLLEASLQHPWFGWGLRQVPMAHNAVLHNYPTAEAFTYAHSIVLDLILGLGYPLALLCMGLVGVWFYRRLRAIQDLTSWYCMALLIPFAIHSLFEFPFAYAYFLLPVGLAIGVLEAQLARQMVVRVPWKLAAGATAAMTLMMLWSVWEYIEIEEDFRVARFEALRIGKTPASYDRPHLVLFDQMDAMLRGIRLLPAPDMDAETIELSRKVAMRFPWIATQNRYALILALNGNPEESIRQLKVIRAMHGEKVYVGIQMAWQELANTKYPQLAKFPMP
jgi:O-antigen ligase